MTGTITPSSLIILRPQPSNVRGFRASLLPVSALISARGERKGVSELIDISGIPLGGHVTNKVQLKDSVKGIQSTVVSAVVHNANIQPV